MCFVLIRTNIIISAVWAGGKVQNAAKLYRNRAPTFFTFLREMASIESDGVYISAYNKQPRKGIHML